MVCSFFFFSALPTAYYPLPTRFRPLPNSPPPYKHYSLSTARPAGYNHGMNCALAHRTAPVCWLALALACVLSTLVVAADASGQTQPAASERATPTVVIGLHGEIDEYNKAGFMRRFATARAQGAKVVIVRIDTYGGLVTSGLDLSRFIKNQSDIHTIAYVDTKAISAGAMIAMACDEIVMANDAVLGDCAPIARRSSGDLEPLPAAERAKMESPILADFRDSAFRNRHDPLLAAAMVSVDTTVYWLEGPAGEKRFVNKKDMERLTGDGWKPVDLALNPVDSESTLLTVHTSEAVKLGLATGQAADANQLAIDRNLKIISTLEPGMGEAALDFLNDGVVRMVLLIIFCLSLYVALHAPGHGMSEVLATCALALLVGVPLLTGYATWWEILVIFIGLALIAVEIFLLPHAGMLLGLGALMMVVGFVLTFVGGEGGPGILPTLPQTWASLEHGLFYVVGALIGSIALGAWLSRYLPSLPLLNRLILTATSGGSTATAIAKPPPGIEPLTVAEPAPAWPLLGMVGRAVTPLRPGGSAEFYDEIRADNRVVIVSSESGYIPAGASVIVREVSSNRVKVRAI